MGEVKIDRDVELEKLPPGPWHANGPVVMAGSVPVAWVALTENRTMEQASAIARQFAKLPDQLRLLQLAHPDVMQARIDELEEEVEELRKLLEEKID